jgi:hypothetical protein
MTVLRHTISRFTLMLVVLVGSSLVEEGRVVARAATVTSQRDTGELPITLTRPAQSMIQQQKTPFSTFGPTFYRPALEHFYREGGPYPPQPCLFNFSIHQRWSGLLSSCLIVLCGRID